jgi:hypothetical protein
MHLAVRQSKMCLKLYPVAELHIIIQCANLVRVVSDFVSTSVLSADNFIVTGTSQGSVQSAVG